MVVNQRNSESLHFLAY